MPDQRTPDQVKTGTIASPGFCRIDAEGIHLLSRYRPAHLIKWDEVRALETPKGNCRHDYLKVITSARDYTNPIPVADRSHAGSIARAIAKFRPDLEG